MRDQNLEAGSRSQSCSAGASPHRWAAVPHGRVDLHCHSTASDGALSPAALVAHAAGAGIVLLSLTDHDTVDGLEEAAAAAAGQGIDFVPGVEITVSWEGKTLHIVGLNIDPAAASLSRLLRQLQQQRCERAQQMAERLERLGVADAHDRALALAAGGQITRAHMARLLVETGVAKDNRQAFKRFLRHGRPAYVRQDWVSLPAAIDGIHASGGLAVLAHPLRYGLSGAWRLRMLVAFKAAGGEGLEVSAGSSQQVAERALMTAEAERHGLLGSVASDFHGPEQSWLPYGRLAPLGAAVQPIWLSF